MNRLFKFTVFTIGTGAAVLVGWYMGALQPLPAAVPVLVPAAKTPVPSTGAITRYKQGETPNHDAQLVRLETELKALRQQVDRMTLRLEVDRMTALSIRDKSLQPKEQAKQKRSQDFYEQQTIVEGKFRGEAVDPAWSGEKSAELKYLLADFPELVGAAVECRSASCLMTLPPGVNLSSDPGGTDGTSPMAFIQQAQEYFPSVEIFQGSGTGQTNLYLSSEPAPDPNVDPTQQPKVASLSIYTP